MIDPMKNNRQIGLDGRSFVTACLRRSPYCVLGLIVFGVLCAVSDILKLTGASGAVMGSFTTTLLIYDLLAAMMLVVVTFYAYFLECGLNIPKLREKPLIIFGGIRLCYYVLLGYYLCYRALYCMAYSDVVPAGVAVFYTVMFAATFLAVFGNSFYLNVLSRNMIRRSYEKSFARFSVFGVIFQLAVPVAYIIARFTMGEYTDEYFTHSVCDLLRLCVSPLFYTCFWLIYYRATEQVREVYSEVDDALRNKRYQITYSAEETKKEKRKKSRKQRRKIKQLRKKAAEAQNQALAAALASGIAAPQEPAPQPEPEEKTQPSQEAVPQETTEPQKEETAKQETAAQQETARQTAPQPENAPEQPAVQQPKLGVSAFTAAQIEQIAQKAVSDAAAAQPQPQPVAQQPVPQPVVYAAPGEVEEYDPYRAQRPQQKKPQQVRVQNGQPQKRPQGGGKSPNGQRGGKNNKGNKNKKYYPPKNPNGQH